MYLKVDDNFGCFNNIVGILDMFIFLNLFQDNIELIVIYMIYMLNLQIVLKKIDKEKYGEMKIVF